MSWCFHMAALYVGDLHPDVTEAMLYEKFSAVGPLLSLRVCRDAISRRSLGYAYVNYQQPGDAEGALDTMNFDLIKGKPIRIMWSQRDPSLRKSGVGNLFIKNLDKNIDNKSMYDTFSAFGNILSCKVMLDENGMSKGYGFIHFETEESAKKAIEKVNGMLLNNKKVYVGKFIPHKERCKQIGTKPKIFTNIYVKNMVEMSENKLYDTFSKYGKITSCVVMRNPDGSSRGFGFVAFESPTAAETAVSELHEKETDGQKLYVAKAQKKSERQMELKRRYDDVKTERYNRTQGVNLFLKNLDDTIDDARLRKEFAQFGTITSAKVMTEDGRSKGFGFVCYSTPEEATKALMEMHGKMLGSKPIYVALAQRKEDRKAFIASHLQRIRIQPNLYPTTPQFLMPAVAQGHRFYNMNHIRSTPRWLASTAMRPNGTYPTLANSLYRVSSRPSAQGSNPRNAITARPITGQTIHSRPNSKKWRRHWSAEREHVGFGYAGRPEADPRSQIVSACGEDVSGNGGQDNWYAAGDRHVGADPHDRGSGVVARQSGRGDCGAAGAPGTLSGAAALKRHCQEGGDHSGLECCHFLLRRSDSVFSDQRLRPLHLVPCSLSHFEFTQCCNFILKRKLQKNLVLLSTN